MKRINTIIYCLSGLLFSMACTKSDFLDKKPSLDLTVPVTLTDYENLLENINIFNRNGSLPHINGDEYEVTVAEWQSATVETLRNSYIWASDLYGGDEVVRSWNDLYTSVFYANSVLDGLESSGLADLPQGQYLKGWALFARAYAFYDLTRNFAKSFDETTASTDLGIPIRLSPGIDYTIGRATLAECYERIMEDLAMAEQLLPAERPSEKLNRPSKIAVYALLARIYLEMRDYPLAESNADKCLDMYDTLLDYKDVNVTAPLPFNATNPEIIYFSGQVPDYLWTTILTSVSSELIGLYSPNDLRLAAFYNRQANGTYRKKSNYYGSGGYPFTGLATDEIHLIKSECLARRGEIGGSMEILNNLVEKRWSQDATTPANPYRPITAVNVGDALEKVLLERRKELAWRGVRWHDLKRLNKDGANFTLTRELDGVIYSLSPNDNRYVFPIPNQEIILSSIEQNQR